MTHQLPGGNTGGEVPKAGPLASEPVLTTNTITGLVVAVLVLLREFGVPLTPGQHLAIVGVLGPLLLIGGSFLARRLVTPLVDPTDNQGRPLVPAPPDTATGRTLR